MLLQYLIEDLEKEVKGNLNLEINKIEYDSNKIEKNDVFVAIHGFKTNGHEYIVDAIDNGAIAIVIDKSEEENVEKLGLKDSITIVVVENTRLALAVLSSKFYDYPAKKLSIIGITGTKGKTTTAYMIRDIMKAAKKKCGLIGTIANEYGDVSIEASRTSPESLDLQKLLKNMVDSGMEYVVMEVSSHALELYRVHGIKFEIGVFTNLSRRPYGFSWNYGKLFKCQSKII